MAYKVIYKIIGQNKWDSFIVNNYDELIGIFNSIKISWWFLNNQIIEGMNHFENFKILEINYDNEDWWTQNIKWVSIGKDWREEIEYFDINQIDEIEVIENDITNKFNLDLGKYNWKEQLKYYYKTSKLFYLWEFVHTFRESVGRKPFIELMLSKKINEIVKFTKIQTEIDNWAYTSNLSDKQDKDIRNIIDKVNKLLEIKIKIKKVFSLSKEWLWREVYRII